MIRLRAAAPVLLAVAFAGCLPWPSPTKTPNPTLTVRAIPRSFMESLVSARTVSGVKLKIYNTGAVHTRGGAVSAIKSWSARVTLDVPVFAVSHPTQGIVLFDTGLTTATASRLNGGLLTGLVVRFASQPGRDAVSQLSADGVKPEDVRWIVISHLHLDHLGTLDQFPKATVVVSKTEWESQKQRLASGSGGADKEFDPAAWESRLRLRLVDLDGQPPFGAFDHGLDLFEDGVVELVALPGHTPGSVGAWINLDGGPVLLAGDAAWVVDNYLDLSFPHKRGIRDMAQYRHSIDMIRAMQDAVPRLVIFPGHDLTPRTLTTRDDLPLAAFPR